MSEQSTPPDIQTAYRIIVTLVDTLTASSDLVAVMARLMGEEAVRPLQTEPAWQAYLEAKRRLEAVHDDMHRFAAAAIAQAEAAAASGAAPAEPTPDEHAANSSDEPHSRDGGV